MRYRVFLRAVLDTPHKHLYTWTCVKFRLANYPQRPNPNADSSYVPVTDTEETE